MITVTHQKRCVASWRLSRQATNRQIAASGADSLEILPPSWLFRSNSLQSPSAAMRRSAASTLKPFASSLRSTAESSACEGVIKDEPAAADIDAHNP
ncbi:hypothetical protein [Aureimonas sp. AU20]|uniref:hypothetical protein n=1 Tax=Aureimonas sp. AU20 TaxID=1349819 RepID=UPI00165129AA|nr:hypothetical protein [Aureimonas sp. AU20]